MTLREWLDVANALRFIDLEEFRRAVPCTAFGVATSDSIGVTEWNQFQLNPARWLARQPDDVAERVFALALQKRTHTMTQEDRDELLLLVASNCHWIGGRADFERVVELRGRLRQPRSETFSERHAGLPTAPAATWEPNSTVQICGPTPKSRR